MTCANAGMGPPLLCDTRKQSGGPKQLIRLALRI